ncbi:MAG: efflux RND transporter periplasmic adaptor subunit [bacterium]
MTNKKQRVLIGVGLVVLFVIGLKLSRRAIIPGDVVVTVQEGPFKSELMLIGEIRAVNSTNITPRTYGKIANLVPEGTIVEKGQPICWFETEELEEELEQSSNSLEIAKKKLLKAEENALLQDRLNLLAIEEAKSRLEHQKSQLAAARSRLEKTQRLVEADISPRKALDDAELEILSQTLQVENAALALEKALNNRESQRELQKADVTTASIEVDQKQVELTRAQTNLNEAITTAPTSGMVLYKEIWKGGNIEKVAIGDQVGNWQPFLEIPDLSELEVIAYVDEVDISRIKENQTAKIYLDAFPELVLHGYIQKIATLADDTPSARRPQDSGGSRKTFEVNIRISDNPDDLRPGITARASVLLYSSDHDIYVPIDSVFTDGEDRVVYLPGSGGSEKRTVKTGAWNAEYMVIHEGIQPGQRILLTRPDNL